jgi:hypothetical protein
MDLYLAAAYQNEQGESNPEHMKIKDWLGITRERRRTYEEALLALNRHKAEHGC